MSELNIPVDTLIAGLDREQLLLLKEKIESALHEDEILLPVSIFSIDLSPGEALVQYLHENRDMPLSQVAELLHKSNSTIWTTYSNARDKGVELKDDGGLRFPLSRYTDKYSLLESIVIYLRDEKHLSNKKVAQLLGRSQPVTSIAYNRGKSR